MILIYFFISCGGWVDGFSISAILKYEIDFASYLVQCELPILLGNYVREYSMNKYQSFVIQVPLLCSIHFWHTKKRKEKLRKLIQVDKKKSKFFHLTCSNSVRRSTTKSLLSDFCHCKLDKLYGWRNVQAVNVLVLQEPRQLDNLSIKIEKTIIFSIEIQIFYLPLIALSSSSRLDPARLAIREETELFSFNFSLVVLVMQSTCSSEMSPSHRMKRPLMSSRCGYGLLLMLLLLLLFDSDCCWVMRGGGAISAERLNSLQRFNEFNVVCWMKFSGSKWSFLISDKSRIASV